MAIVSMPKATVYEYNSVMFRQNYIWFSREIADVYFESKTATV